MQVYPLGEARSLAECSRWSIPLDDSLSLEGMETTVPGHSTHSKDYTRSNFMMHTTVTMREVIGRVQVGPLGSPGQDEAGLCQCLLHMVWRVKPEFAARRNVTLVQREVRKYRPIGTYRPVSMGYEALR